MYRRGGSVLFNIQTRLSTLVPSLITGYLRLFFLKSRKYFFLLIFYGVIVYISCTFYIFFFLSVFNASYFLFVYVKEVIFQLIFIVLLYIFFIFYIFSFFSVFNAIDSHILLPSCSHCLEKHVV